MGRGFLYRARPIRCWAFHLELGTNDKGLSPGETNMREPDCRTSATRLRPIIQGAKVTAHLLPLFGQPPSPRVKVGLQQLDQLIQGFFGTCPLGS